MIFGNKIKKLYNKGALHITIGTFVTKFVAFFGSIVVVRLLSKSDYGMMSYVENIYSYALIFAGFGLSNGILRYLVISEEKEKKKSIFNYIIKRSMIINVAIGAILCILSTILKIPDNYSAVRYLIPTIALLLPFQDLLNESLYTVRAFFRNKMYAYMAFISSLVLIMGRIIGAVVSGVKGVLWSRVLINSIFAIVLFVYISRVFFPRERVVPLQKEQKREINIYSFQYMITNGFWALFMLNDTFLLGILLNDPSRLADYKVAYVLPGNISIFATAVGVFVGPYFAKNEKNKDWVKKNFKKVYTLSAGIVGTVAVLIALSAKPLIQFMYGEQYLNVVGLMRILLVAAFFNSGLRFTTANILASMGEIKYNMIVSGVGIVVQVILDFLLIPHLGVMAVAISNCFVFFLMAVTLFSIFYKKYFSK
ncbi:hypothetical protein IMSAGC020_01763 [Lachnospiraceae bacterium]|nr:hypothetical protein IMSAGC020_01763 [Lachnospiraceae bacterium]